MSLINPGFGLIIWMTLAFAIVLFVLGKYAWKPIMAALKEREESIESSLRAADMAKEEMKNMVIDNEKLLRDAKDERDAILREGRKVREKMIEEAKVRANNEANLIVENAKQRIEHEKKAALIEIKNTIATYSIEFAEKILREEMSDKKKQKEYIERLLKDVKDN
jgi:F-type H+-transporting ATPase subunit b